MRLPILSLAICCTLLSSSTQAQDVTIDGVTVTVSTGTTVTLGSALTNSSDNGLVDLNGTAILTVAGTVTNNSSNTTLFPTDAGDVQLLGSSAQNVSGSNSITFYDLTINNSHASGVTLNTPISVANDLTFTDGDIDMNGNDIDLGSSGQLVGEADDKRIYGTSGEVLASDRAISGTGEVAGLGLVFSTLNSGTIADLDIKRGHAEQTGLYGATSILRYFDLTDNGATFDFDMRIEYFDSELNGKTEADLLVDRSTDGGSTWTAWASSSVTTGSNYGTAPNVTDFSLWTLSTDNSLALPIELLTFNATAIDDQAQVEWSTSSETNNSFFTIERSLDGIHWFEIGYVEGAGNSSVIQSYDFIDDQTPSSQVYYRLKQTDFDGQFQYSEPVALNFEKQSSGQFSVVAKRNQVVITSEQNDASLYQLVNALGEVVAGGDIVNTVTSLDASHLSRGVYLVQAYSKNDQFWGAKKIVLH